MSLVTIHCNSNCLNKSSLKMILGGAFPNMLTIVCCEDVDPVEMGPSGPIRCLTRRCSIAFLVVVTANVTAVEGYGPKDGRSARCQKSEYILLLTTLVFPPINSINDIFNPVLRKPDVT